MRKHIVFRYPHGSYAIVSSARTKYYLESSSLIYLVFDYSTHNMDKRLTYGLMAVAGLGLA